MILSFMTKANAHRTIKVLNVAYILPQTLPGTTTITHKLITNCLGTHDKTCDSDELRREITRACAFETDIYPYDKNKTCSTSSKFLIMS